MKLPMTDLNIKMTDGMQRDERGFWQLLFRSGIGAMVLCANHSSTVSLPAYFKSKSLRIATWVSERSW